MKGTFLEKPKTQIKLLFFNGLKKRSCNPRIAQLVERKTVEVKSSLGPWYESGFSDFLIILFVTLKFIFITFLYLFFSNYFELQFSYYLYSIIYDLNIVLLTVTTTNFLVNSKMWFLMLLVMIVAYLNLIFFNVYVTLGMITVQLLVNLYL